MRGEAQWVQSSKKFLEFRVRRQMKTFLVTAIFFLITSPALCEEADCLAELDGYRVIDGECSFWAVRAGSIHLQASDADAWVHVEQHEALGRVRASGANLNETAQVGEMHKSGACWQNDRARICAWKIGEARYFVSPAPVALIKDARAAQALELGCGAPEIYEGDKDKGSNPITAIHISQTDTSWRIVFYFANGSTVNRAEQYNARTVTASEVAGWWHNSTTPVGGWTGDNIRKPFLHMAGSITINRSGKYSYTETLFDNRLQPGHQRVMLATAVCERTGQSAPSVATRDYPSDPTPLPPYTSPAPAPPASVTPVSPAPTTPATPSTAVAALDAPMTFTVAKNDACASCVGILAVGKIVEDTADQFRQVVADENTKGNRVSIVVFGSPGGALDEGMKLGRLIRRDGIDTGVVGCASACALAFLGGVHRHASANSIGVHQFRDATESKAYSAADVSKAQSIVALLLDYVRDMGVSADFVTTASETPPSDVHWLSSVEMKSFNVTTSE